MILVKWSDSDYVAYKKYESLQDWAGAKENLCFIEFPIRHFANKPLDDGYLFKDTLDYENKKEFLECFDWIDVSDNIDSIIDFMEIDLHENNFPSRFFEENYE